MGSTLEGLCVCFFYVWSNPRSPRQDPTFEADPIGRRLECRPKKGINILINIKFPLGPPGVIKFPLGGPAGV